MNKEEKFKLHLLTDELVKDLYRRRLDQKLEFGFRSIEEMYELVKKSMNEADTIHIHT